MTVLVAVETVAIVLLAVLVAGLLRSHAEILRSLHQLGAGVDTDVQLSSRPSLSGVRDVGAEGAARVVDLSGTSPWGDALAVGVSGQERSTLLAFLSSGCFTCTAFWEAFADAARLEIPGGARLVVVTKGPQHESESKIRELAPRSVPVVMSSEAWDDYHVPVAPYFIYVDGPSARVVGEGAAATWPEVATLLGQALADAGLGATSADGERPSRRPGSEGAREARADVDLLRAGIHPGHPSLTPERLPEPPGEG